jgi:hypothetical protein
MSRVPTRWGDGIDKEGGPMMVAKVKGDVDGDGGVAVAD